MVGLQDTVELTRSLLDADPMLGEQLWQVLELVEGDRQHLRLRAVDKLKYGLSQLQSEKDKFTWKYILPRKSSDSHRSPS